MSDMRRRLVHPTSIDAEVSGPAAVDSLQRGFEVLRCFRRGEDALDTMELARRLALPKATTRRLLDTLEIHGFLLRVPGTEKFGLHVACLVVGQALLGGSVLVRTARPFLKTFAERFGAHALLCMQERTDMLVLAHVAATAAQPFALGAGIKLPIADTALGCAWLWTQPAVVQGEWLARLRECAAPSAGSTQAADVYQAFHDLEDRGVCISHDKSRRGVEFVAAPIVFRDSSAAIIGCVRNREETERSPFDWDCADALVETAGFIREEMQRARG